jgi:5-oxoprolinase (ATP-hydrolysing)
MANAIKKISVQRGHDVTGYTLVLRRRRRPARLPGGRRAGHETGLLHPFAGVLSAYGMGLADMRALREALRRPARRARRRGRRRGRAPGRRRRRRRGAQDRAAPALSGHRHRRWWSPSADADAMRALRSAAPPALRLRHPENRGLIVESVRPRPSAAPRWPTIREPKPPREQPEAIDRVAMVSAGEAHDVPVYDRDAMRRARRRRPGHHQGGRRPPPSSNPVGRRA